MKNFLMIISIVILVMASAYAQNQSSPNEGKESVHSIELPVIQVTLKPGEGMDKTSSLCGICHSLDYITTQPAFPRAQWTGTVNKMIKVMGAPINEEDAKTIINYLVTNYGTGN
jgi:opacity protein-like surface antigen